MILELFPDQLRIRSGLPWGRQFLPTRRNRSLLGRVPDRVSRLRGPVVTCGGKRAFFALAPGVGWRVQDPPGGKGPLLAERSGESKRVYVHRLPRLTWKLTDWPRRIETVLCNAADGSLGEGSPALLGEEC